MSQVLNRHLFLLKAHLEKGKVELKFRPSDQYCKPAVSKAVVGSNLVLKVKRRKNGLESDKSSTTEGKEKGVDFHYSVELIGICNKTYQFTGTQLCTVFHSYSVML